MYSKVATEHFDDIQTGLLFVSYIWAFVNLQFYNTSDQFAFFFLRE